jgi:predicted SAM-dependent methyltransferase
MLKLHIGSRTRTEGWKTLDIEGGPEVDYTGNCKDLSQFAASSVDAIYASHVLEHLGYQEDLLRALREWFRVLKPGAPVMISVPDLETLCRLFLHPQSTADNRFQIMRIMFGGQMEPHDYHYVGLNLGFLRSYLKVAGFADIERVQDFGIFEDTSKMKFGGVPISLNVKAVKQA